jgi:RNA polymerase sigma-70 factor (ECF subfamily)
MPSVRQRVFAMSRFKGMSYKEIADDLSISVRTVENHIAQALKQLRHNIPFL